MYFSYFPTFVYFSQARNQLIYKFNVFHSPCLITFSWNFHLNVYQYKANNRNSPTAICSGFRFCFFMFADYRSSVPLIIQRHKKYYSLIPECFRSIWSNMQMLIVDNSIKFKFITRTAIVTKKLHNYFDTFGTNRKCLFLRYILLMFSRFGPIYIYGPLFIPFVLDTYIIWYTILERKNHGKISKKSLAFVWWNSTYKIFYNIWARFYAFYVLQYEIVFRGTKCHFLSSNRPTTYDLIIERQTKRYLGFCLPRFFHFLLCTWMVIGLVVFFLFSFFCSRWIITNGVVYGVFFCKQWPDREALNTFKDLQRRQRGEWSTRQVYIEHWTCINLTYWKGTFVSKSD